MSENNTPVRKFSSAGAEKLREMTENSDMYIDFLKFQGRVFKHSTSVALEFFTQRPETKFIATKEQWAMTNRTVAMGSEAIRFVDSNGKNVDFYDFSQVEETAPPYQWTINAKNANEVKKQLGIPEKMSIISGVINSDIKPEHITSCMSALGIPPKEYKAFSKSYINAIQLVIAGRLEIGGNNFNIPSDLTVLKMLKTEQQKLAFLTHAANTARKSLMKIEKAVQNINTIERNERNDLREMENTNSDRTAEHTGRRTAVNTAGTAGEQPNRSESNESGRSTGLGNNAESPEWKEHEVVSGVQNENGGQSGILVQVRPDMRTVQPESDGIRAVNGGRTDRNLRNEMDGLHGEELSASGGGNEAVSQVSDSSPFSREERTGVQGYSGRPIRTGESTSDGLRGSTEMGTGENVLLGQHSNERSGLSSGNESIEEKLNNVFSSGETEKTSTEKAGVFVLDDKEKLVQITAQIGEKEKVFTDLANAEEKDYNLISDVVREIQELKKVQAELKEKIQAEPLTEKDVEILLGIKPSKKPVQNMTETEVAKTTKFESMLNKEMGGKSPYAMRKKGGNDWRNDESKKVRISEVQPHSTSRPEIMADYRDPDNLLLKDSKYLNPDTGATIFLDKDGISETIAKAMVDKKHSKPYKAPLAALYHIEDLIENSICFDSQISKYDKNTAKNKSPNTMFMHRFYGVIKYNDDFYLTNMAIEETYKSKDSMEIDSTKNHLYSLRGIKITPIGNLGLIPRYSSSTDESGSPSSVTEISIPQLYRFVKAFDTNFFENPNSVGREARETELFLQAEYADAVNEDENQTETKEQIVEFAKSHNIAVHKAKRELEQAVERYDGFIADEKKNKGFSEERNHELERCIHKSFEKIREINNFTEEQLNFINNLEKFSITNHVINNMINSAFEKSNRFSSLYVSENWVNSSIFNGHLSEVKKALNEEIKAQIELLKQEKAQKSLTEKEKKSVSEITETDLTDGIENAPQIQITSDVKVDMEEIPQIIFLETDNSDGKFHFNETIFTYDIANVAIDIQESSDNLYDFDNQETLSVEDGAERISELLERYSEKNIHISLVYENGESESLMQYVNHTSGDYPMIESFFNNNVPEFVNPQPDDRKAPKSKIYTVEEYNDLLAKASDNIQEGQSFKLHFKVILSDRRSYSETFELTKNTGKLSEILNSSENKSKSDRNFLKALKMISEKEKSPEISEIKADSDDNSKRSKNGDIIIGNTTFRYIPQKTYTKIDKETAVKVAEQLENQGIKFSGVIKGDTATITVSKPQKEILDSIIANISSSENVDNNNDNFNENAVKYAFSRIMEEHKYDFTNPTFMYLGHLQNYMIEHKIDDIVIGATSETLRKHYGNALLTEEYFSHDYTFSRDLPKEYTTYFQEYISMENVKPEREKQTLISVEIFGEKYYFKINENSIDDILKTANAEKPLLEFMEIGEKVSEYEYSKIQQSDSFAYSVEMNLDNDTASIYMVNNGKGGISEADRTDSNATFDTVKISDYSNPTDITVDDLSVGDIILYDGKRREVEQINEKQISLKNLDAPDFDGILLSTSDVYAYDGWQEDMNTKGFEVISKAEPEITLNVDEKIYQVVTCSNDSIVDYQDSFATMDNAVEEGRNYLYNANFRDYYSGIAILNTKDQKVEYYEGEFPLEGIFSEQVYKNSGTWFTAKPLPNNIKEELEKNIDKFYINKENESVTWVYFNPDSDSGGQLVYNTFDFDTLKSAAKAPEKFIML